MSGNDWLGVSNEQRIVGLHYTAHCHLPRIESHTFIHCCKCDSLGYNIFEDVDMNSIDRNLKRKKVFCWEIQASMSVPRGYYRVSLYPHSYTKPEHCWYRHENPQFPRIYCFWYTFLDMQIRRRSAWAKRSVVNSAVFFIFQCCQIIFFLLHLVVWNTGKKTLAGLDNSIANIPINLMVYC